MPFSNKYTSLSVCELIQNIYQMQRHYLAAIPYPRALSSTKCHGFSSPYPIDLWNFRKTSTTTTTTMSWTFFGGISSLDGPEEEKYAFYLLTHIEQRSFQFHRHGMFFLLQYFYFFLFLPMVHLVAHQPHHIFVSIWGRRALVPLKSIYDTVEIIKGKKRRRTAPYSGKKALILQGRKVHMLFFGFVLFCLFAFLHLVLIEIEGSR